MKKKILVLGFGNEFCGDDGLGPYVVRLIKDEFSGSAVIIEDRKQKAESSRQKAKPNKESLLPTTYCLLPSVVLQTVRHLDFSWAENLAAYRHLIFVDASTHRGYPLVRVKDLSKSRGTARRAPASSHHISITHLLQITQELYGQKPSAFLVAVGGENFDFGENISPRGRKSAPLAVKKILGLIKDLAPTG